MNYTDRAPFSLPRGRLLDGRLFLRACLVIGLLLRGAILWNTANLGTEIVDEQHYSQLAGNILSGNGFAWGPGQPTSIRPPLYPALVATIWSVIGSHSLQAVRIVQVVLALATSFLVYLLGKRVYGAPVGRYAAAICWWYPSFILFNSLILTETLFTLLFVALALWSVLLVQEPRASFAVLCGISLGLAALTRSVLWPLPLLLCPLLAVLIRAPLARRLALPALVLAGYALVVTPWAVRNTRLQGTLTIVDTMGGMNLRMGNYEYTPDDRMWDAVNLMGEKSWAAGFEADHPGQVVTEGVREKWAQRKAIEFMREHPGTTLRRSLIKFADFWGLEREFIGGVQQGLFDPPQWFSVIASVCIVGAYIAIVVAGAAGIWLSAPEDRRLQVLLLLPSVAIVAGHTIVFGHSRYHLPLMPILGLYAAAFVLNRAPSFRLALRPTLVGATVSVTMLITIWVRQVVFVDLPRIAAVLHHVG